MIAILYVVMGVLFLLILISMGAEPKWIKRVTGWVLAFVAAAGILLYGYGYYVLYGGSVLTVLRTLFSVLCMFLGRNEIGTISAVPLLGSDFMQFILYLVHFLALYCIAGALVTALGTDIVRGLHLLLIHRKDLALIYGVNSESVSFAEKLGRDSNVVFVDADGKDDFGKRIRGMGGLLLHDERIDPPTASLLRRLGIRPGRRRYTVYCFDASTDRNMVFASALRDLFEQAGIKPEQTGLTIFLQKESDGDILQVSKKEDRYGYGTVYAVNTAELIGRTMVRAFPPYRTMSFDAEGRAKQDFEAVIVGFGSTGQAVLKSLLMNGQFEGSRFHALVISLDHEAENGRFLFRCPEIIEKYDIEFVNRSARSIDVYRILAERRERIRYVAVCTGNEKNDSEIMRDYADLFTGTGIPVIRCSADGIFSLNEQGISVKSDIYSPEVLCVDRIDRMARIINHQYHRQEGNTAEEDWADCDYFSRMSCRASADFMNALLYEAGSDPEKAAEGWQPSGKLLENLSRTEHRRWCAFHYVMGFLPMPESVFAEKAERYRKEIEETGQSSVRLSKDLSRKYHACLVDWEELDALSEREEAITGRKPDYKQMDADNVLIIPQMLREAAAE